MPSKFLRRQSSNDDSPATESSNVNHRPPLTSTSEEATTSLASPGANAQANTNSGYSLGALPSFAVESMTSPVNRLKSESVRQMLGPDETSCNGPAIPGLRQRVRVLSLQESPAMPEVSCGSAAPRRNPVGTNPFILNPRSGIRDRTEDHLRGSFLGRQNPSDSIEKTSTLTTESSFLKQKRPFLSRATVLKEKGRKGQLQRRYKMPVGFVIRQLHYRVQRNDVLAEFFLFLVYLILFCLFAHSDSTRIENDFWVAVSTRQQFERTEFPAVSAKLDTFREQRARHLSLWVELDKRYEDIGNQEDWQFFFTNVVLATLFKGPKSGLHMRGMYSAKGQIVQAGSMRVRTIRMAKRSGKLKHMLYPLGENASLIPDDTWARGAKERFEQKDNEFCKKVVNPFIDTGDVRLFQYHDCSAYTSLWRSNTYGLLGTYHCGGYSFEVPFDLSEDQADQLGKSVTGSCSFTDTWASRFTVVEFFTYTPHSDSWHSVKYRSEVDTSGWYLNRPVIRSFRVYTPVMSKDIIFNAFVPVVFLYCVLIWLAHAIRSIIQRKASLRIFFGNMYNIYDLAIMATSVSCFYYRWHWMQLSLSVQEEIKLPMPAGYPIFLDMIQSVYERGQILCVVNVVLLFQRFLKFAIATNATNMVMDTLSSSKGSLFGAVALFFLILIAYSVSGWLLFGEYLDSFRTFGETVTTLLLTAMGSVDYKSMRQANRHLAAVYLWSYLILNFYMLLNFIIAIISLTFTKISQRNLRITNEEWLMREAQYACDGLKLIHWKSFPFTLVALSYENRRLRDIVRALEVHVFDEVGEAEATSGTPSAQLPQESVRACDGSLTSPASRRESDVRPVENYGCGLHDALRRPKQMHYTDWQRWMPAEVYKKAGGAPFFGALWDSLMNDCDDDMKTSKDVTLMKFYEEVQRCAQKVVGGELNKIDQVDRTLERLEEAIAGAQRIRER